jgi:hypothetical protein
VFIFVRFRQLVDRATLFDDQPLKTEVYLIESNFKLLFILPYIYALFSASFSNR